jgi:hypothetical protein
VYNFVRRMLLSIMFWSVSLDSITDVVLIRSIVRAMAAPYAMPVAIWTDHVILAIAPRSSSFQISLFPPPTSGKHVNEVTGPSHLVVRRDF